MPRHRPLQQPQTAPLDGTALALAIWLGLLAAVTGFARLSQTAALDGEHARSTHATTPTTTPELPQPEPAF